MGNHVFICYAREDEKFVLKLAANLRGRGVPVWLDQWAVPAGADWDHTIDNAIYDCAKFLIVLSPTAVESQEVRGELRTALDERKSVTPIIYQACRIPRQLRTVQYVDFTSRSPEDATVLDQVVRALGGEQPPSSPRRDEDPPRAIPSQSRREKRSWLSLSVSLIGLVAILYLLNLLRTHPASPPREPPLVEEKPGLSSRPSPAPSQPVPSPEKKQEALSESAPKEASTPPSEVKTKQGKDSKEMASIPAGGFWMGCNEKVDQECDNDEKPGKTVDVGEFWIDRTEVPVAEYRRCVQAGGCSSNGLTMPYWDDKEQPEWAWACNWGKDGRENHPINCVDWSQAQAYCKWAGQKRLPTEAEWEKAARGTDGRKYPWGNLGFGKAGKVANIADEAAKKKQPQWLVAKGYDDGYYGTAPVGSYPAGASPYGALDMSGNVWEWTADWYDSEHKYRSVRGGSWGVVPGLVRVSYRGWGDPGVRDGYVGFRCAQ